MNVPNLHFVQLARPYWFTTPVPGHEFAAWIVASDATITSDERDRISTQLVAAGCRYAVCSGHDCSRWDDAVDMADISRYPDFQPRDEGFVMTSWHEKQNAPDIAFFFVMCTHFDDWTPTEFVVVAVGDGPDGETAFMEARKELSKPSAR